MERITVLGGGIGGLAVATALAQRGMAVQVLEHAAALSEVGAGVQISPNGFAVLRAIGLADVARAAATHSQAVTLRDRRGQRILRMDVGGRDFLLFHRAELIGLLTHAAGEAGVELRLGQRVERIVDGPEARLCVNGEPSDVSFIVGADGLHSVARRALNGDDAPFFTGQVAWRAQVAGAVAPEAVVHMAPGRHLVSYPLRDGTIVNLVGVEARAAWTAEGWNLQGDPAEFRAAFSMLPSEARSWLDRVERVHLWGLFRHPVAQRWHGASVALLGDAAHPTLPFLAQGANLALEDAWCLAEALSASDRPAALHRYQAARAPRVARAIAAADANARNFHLSGLSAVAAHAALRVADRVAPGVMMRRLDWLYGHDVTAR